MQRMLVVVFEDESKADEGARTLRQLDLDGHLTVYRRAIVVKNPDGTVKLREFDDRGPFGLLVGTALGALLGALGGLAGIGIGGTVGLVDGRSPKQLRPGGGCLGVSRHARLRRDVARLRHCQP